MTSDCEDYTKSARACCNTMAFDICLEALSMECLLKPFSDAALREALH